MRKPEYVPKKPEPSRLTPRGNRLKLVQGNGKRGNRRHDAANAKARRLSTKSQVAAATGEETQ